MPYGVWKIEQMPSTAHEHRAHELGADVMLKKLVISWHLAHTDWTFTLGASEQWLL